MEKQLKEIEEKILVLFDELRKEIPTLHHMDFEVTKYDGSAISRVHGFFHTSKCESYYNITELIILISQAKKERKREKILFQKFNHVLS